MHDYLHLKGRDLVYEWEKEKAETYQLMNEKAVGVKNFVFESNKGDIREGLAQSRYNMYRNLRKEEVGQKIAATRRANVSYDHNGMTGKTHKESTKAIQGQKAKIRQELKRKLGLGKSDSVPKDLLEKEYKKQGLL
jgi:hypothetical protein